MSVPPTNPWQGVVTVNTDSDYSKPRVSVVKAWIFISEPLRPDGHGQPWQIWGAGRGMLP